MNRAEIKALKPGDWIKDLFGHRGIILARGFFWITVLWSHGQISRYGYGNPAWKLWTPTTLYDKEGRKL